MCTVLATLAADLMLAGARGSATRYWRTPPVPADTASPADGPVGSLAALTKQPGIWSASGPQASKSLPAMIVRPVCQPVQVQVPDRRGTASCSRCAAPNDHPT